MKKISWDSIPDPGELPARRTRTYLDARSAAIAYIGIGRKTTGRVRIHLLRKAVAEEIADLVVADLIQDGYLDDMTYGQSLLEARTGANSESVIAARTRLLRLGVNPDAVNALMQDYAPSESRDELVAILRKKYGRFLDDSGKIPADAPPGLAMKMARYLAGRGFSYENIQAAVAALANANGRGAMDEY